MFYSSVRRVFEQFCPKDASPEAKVAGSFQFAEHFRRDLGLTANEYGRPIIKEAKFSPREFSLRGLAESLVGYEWVETLMRDNGNAYRIFEAGGESVTPGNLPNVSAYLGSVSGLLDAALLQGFDQPDFIIDQLVPVDPAKTRQTKIIGAGRIGDQSQRRNPGEPHPWAQFEERYVTTQETQNDALAVGVTFEAVFFDQTGMVLDKANAVGTELGLRKELDGMRLIAGVDNPYNYRGVSYNTYLTAGNWINDHANELLDWTSVNTTNSLFSRMTDQETGNRIAVSWDTMLVSPTKQLTAQYIQNATEVESRTQGVADQGFQQIRRGPRLGDQYRVLSSVYLDQIATAADGLNLSQANADKYWWALKTSPGNSAFVRMENWPFTIQRASPTDFNMLNHKLALAVFADQMHSFNVREPRFVIRNKN